MHVINFPSGATFVHHSRFTETLFKPIDGKTATGTYEFKEGGLLFRKGNNEPFLMLVCNRWQEKFFVSCHKYKNRIRYLNGVCSIDEELIGFDKIGYLEQSNLARSIHTETQEYYEKEWKQAVKGE